jgi:hypothetical protein
MQCTYILVLIINFILASCTHENLFYFFAFFCYRLIITEEVEDVFREQNESQEIFTMQGKYTNNELRVYEICHNSFTALFSYRDIKAYSSGEHQYSCDVCNKPQEY